jgi:hypothetical protein
MNIIASTIELSSAHLFAARRSVREETEFRILPVEDGDRDRRGPPVPAREVDQVTRLLRRYFERSIAGKDTAKLSERIDALVKRIEARLAEAATVEVRRREESYREVELTRFRAAGSVTTADGREIDIAAALDLARAFARSGTSLTVTEPDSGDRTLTTGLAVGGGILGLDLNEDGVVDPATEVVGASGDGFAELARYDDDGNGFIDGGDSVFRRLAVLATGDQGIESASLADRGVGAVYLGSVSAPFTVRGPAGEVTAELTRTGIYLNEDGTTGVALQLGVPA